MSLPQSTIANSPPARGALRLLETLALAALGVASVWSVAIGFRDAMLYSQDFQWSPSVLLLEGKDPYAWYLSGNDGGRIILSQEPNYLHALYLLMMPLAAAPWALAKACWAACNTAMGIACAHVIARKNGLEGNAYRASVLTFLCSIPFSNTVGNGQQGMLALAAMTFAWGAAAPVSKGMAFALGSTKYSFAPPFALWMLMEGDLAALAVAGLASIAAAAVFASIAHAGFPDTLMMPLRVSAKATGIALADVVSLARSLRLDTALFPGASYLAGAAAATTAVLAARARNVDRELAFALVCQISLFALFHQLYDYVFLMPLFCRAFTFPSRLRALVFAYVAWFWFGCKAWDMAGLNHPTVFVAACLCASAAVFAVILKWGVQNAEWALRESKN